MPTRKNQFRFVTSLRRDYYQIPYDPDPNADPSSNGLRDSQQESDAVVDFSWVRTFNPNLVMTVSPFYHYNSANYEGSPNDFPISTTDERGSKYGGAQATLNFHFAKNDTQAGFYGFSQHDNQTFGLVFNDGSNTNFQERESPLGNLESLFLDDKFKMTSWLTLIGRRSLHPLLRLRYRRTPLTHDSALRCKFRVSTGFSAPSTGSIIRPRRSSPLPDLCSISLRARAWASFLCTVSATKKARSA